MSLQVLDASPDVAGGYKVDVSRGARVGRVSSEWFSRPDDERYLSLTDLHASVKGRAAKSRARTVESAAIRVEASRDDAERLELLLPESDTPVAPTHWSFGQLSSLVGAPASYLRQLPAPLAAIDLQYGIASHRGDQFPVLVGLVRVRQQEPGRDVVGDLLGGAADGLLVGLEHLIENKWPAS